MKLKLMVLALAVALCAFPAMAQDTSTHTVSFDALSFSYDTTIADNVSITQFAGDPADLEQPGGPEAPHTQFLLYSGDTVPDYFDAAAWIRVYQTANLANYELANQQYETLQSLLTSRPDLSTFSLTEDGMSETTLPFLPVQPASQVLYARAQYLERNGITGISYVTAYRQDVSPFQAADFYYTFQGISTDGATYVAGVIPVSIADFPEETPADFDYDALVEDYNNYILESATTVNSTAPESFTPSLSAVESLVNSLVIAGVGEVVVPPTVLATPEVTEVASEPNVLTGTWTLVSYGSVDAPQPALEAAPVTISFTGEGVSGTTGCNQFGGSYQFENNTLTFSEIVSTLIACQDDVMAQENALLDALNTSTSFEIVDGQLVISYEGGTLVFNAV